MMMMMMMIIDNVPKRQVQNPKSLFFTGECTQTRNEQNMPPPCESSMYLIFPDFWELGKNLHPWKLTWNLKITQLKRTSSSIHLHFSGAILVSGRVHPLKPTYTPWNYHNPKKMMASNRNLPFQGFFFQFHGGKCSVPNLASRLHEPPLGCPVGSAGNRLGR